MSRRQIYPLQPPHLIQLFSRKLTQCGRVRLRVCLDTTMHVKSLLSSLQGSTPRSAQVWQGTGSAHRLDVKRANVVPPMGTALPGPWTSHIVKTICDVRSREGYLMGSMMVWFHLLGVTFAITGSWRWGLTCKLEQNPCKPSGRVA